MRNLSIIEIEFVSGGGVTGGGEAEMEWRYIKTVTTVKLPDGSTVTTVTYEWKLVAKASVQL